MAAMLEFPNPTRSFDEKRKAVRFIGYDDMVQVPFFVEAGALSISGRSVASEAECLRAFDASRGSIYNTARKAYSRGRSKPYTLTAADF